jgi:hypothetical protein
LRTERVDVFLSGRELRPDSVTTLDLRESGQFFSQPGDIAGATLDAVSVEMFHLIQARGFHHPSPDDPDKADLVEMIKKRNSRPHEEVFNGANLFSFITRDGAEGLLQIVGPSERPPGVRIRYKLVRNVTALSAPSTSTNVPSTYSFGPEVMRVIQSGETRTNLFLNLNTGQLLTPPEEIRALLNESYTKRNSWEFNSDPRAEKIREWLRSSGANLMISDGGRGLERLEIREAVALAPTVISNGVTVPFGFDQADAVYLAARIKPMLESVQAQRHSSTIWLLQPGFDSRLNTRRDSFCFRTSAGIVGLLQILNAEENPSGIRVRYKLLQTK